MTDKTVFPDDLFDLATEVRQTAAEFPDRTAVMEPYRSGDGWAFRTWTYRELSRDADIVAAALHARGYGPGLRVVFMAPPSYQASVVGIALSQLGVTSFGIDPSVGYRNVAERLSRIKPEAFVGIPVAHLGRLVFGWGPRFLKKSIVLDGWFPGSTTFKQLVSFPGSRQEKPKVSVDAPCAVLYTTGSTGPAKPAMYSQSQFCNVYRTAHYSWRFDKIEGVPVDMAAFPAFMYIVLSAGGTMVVPPFSFARITPATTPAREVCEVIEAAKVTSLFASPAFLERIADYAKANPAPLSNLRRVIGGGAPLFSPLISSLLEVIHPEGDACPNYGATEALPSTEFSGRESLAETVERTAAGEGICVGYPFPKVEVRVVSPIGGDSINLRDYQTLATGIEGELIVSGPNISTAYFDDEKSTKKNKLYGDDGHVWHRLGDVGHLDEKGRVWVQGRINQCVRLDDELLLPIGIEAKFDRYPEVRRSGLAACRNHQGVLEAVVAVETKEGVSEAEKQRLLTDLKNMVAKDAALARVADVVLLDALPVDPRHNAKIERGKLAALLQKRYR